LRKTTIALAMLTTLSAFSTVAHAETLIAPYTSRTVSADRSGFISAATVDSVTFSFIGLTLTGFEFSQLAGPLAGFMSGTLTNVSVDATLDASEDETYADDLAIYVKAGALATGGLLQVGGFSDLGASERYGWANGGSPAVGTTVIDSYLLVTPLTFAGTAADPLIWLGNGYGAAGTQGTWTGSITLTGLNVAAVVPEPSSWALMALGGLGMVAWVGRRRRNASV